MDLIFAVSITCIENQGIVLQQTLHPRAVFAVYCPVMDNSRRRNNYAFISVGSLYIGGTKASVRIDVRELQEARD